MTYNLSTYNTSSNKGNTYNLSKGGSSLTYKSSSNQSFGGSPTNSYNSNNSASKGGSSITYNTSSNIGNTYNLSKGGSSLTYKSSSNQSFGGSPTNSYNSNRNKYNSFNSNGSSTNTSYNYNTGGRPVVTTNYKSTYKTTASTSYFTKPAITRTHISSTIRFSSSYIYARPTVYSSTIYTYNPLISFNYSIGYRGYSNRFNLLYYLFTPSYYNAHYVTTIYRPRILTVRSYYVRNYRSYYYYRPPLRLYIGNNQPSTTTNGNVQNSNKIELPAENDPANWLPATSKPIDKNTLTKTINSSMKDVKIYIRCSEEYCITYIPTINSLADNLSTKKRIYIDYNLRKYSFININELTMNQKQCLIEQIFTLNNDKTQAFKSCNIDIPYTINPIKLSSIEDYTQQCEEYKFYDSVKRFTTFLPSSSSVTCAAPDACLKETSNQLESDKLACGATLFDMYLPNRIRTSFEGLSTQCKKTNTATSFLSLKTETKESTNGQALMLTGQYIDEKALSQADLSALGVVNTIVTEASDKNNIEIDGSDKSNTSTSGESDLQKIEAESDSITGVDQQNQQNQIIQNSSIFTRPALLLLTALYFFLM